MNTIKRILIGFALLYGLFVLSLIGLSDLSKSSGPQVSTFSGEEEISIDARQTAFQPLLIAPYKTYNAFLSDIKESAFDFTSVGGSWIEETPQGTNLEGYIRFEVDEKWSEWLKLEGEKDVYEEDRQVAMASTNPAQAMQYKFVMYGDGISTPSVKDIEWTYIRSHETKSITPTPVPAYGGSGIESYATYLALNVSKKKVIQRSSWGANEDYRYLENNTSDPVLLEVSDKYYDNYKNELKYKRVVGEDSTGDQYKWPLQYPVKVDKIIIHHTASTGNLSNPAQAIRDMYYYHAVTRGWGDIGYNYIIDTSGNIYEGRYGGEGVVGAHAGGANTGSIGIAVLGNYEDSPVPEKVVTSISEFIAEKAKINKIDPVGKSSFRGEFSNNIIGHRDVMSTACPGEYLYDKLAVIRSLAKKYMNATVERYKKDYAFIDDSDVYYIELKPDEEKKITLKLENIGKKTWGKDTFLVVDKNPSFEGVIGFEKIDSIKLAKMKESSVAPGKDASFTFTVRGGKRGGMVDMTFTPVVNGKVKTRDSVSIPLVVQQVDYTYKLLDSKFPPEVMEKGEEFKGWIKLQNTGNITWRKKGDNTVLIGTDHPRDRLSEFFSGNKSRIATLKEEEVAPGETGVFEFSIKAPTKPGYYKEYFSPVVEGVTWMKDTGTYFETTVAEGAIAAEIGEISAKADWEKGKKYVGRIAIRNMGTVEWKNSDISVSFLKDNDLTITQAKLVEEKVAPGKVGTISFVGQVSTKETLGTKNLLVNVKYKKQKLTKVPIRMKYKVVSAIVSKPNSPAKTSSNKASSSTKKASGAEEDIRVKLSFSGNPKITSTGFYEIYGGSSLLTVIGEKAVEVKYENSKYKIITSTKTYTSSSPVRFVPKDGAIMEIENFENRPEWKQSLNDNTYRGVLEVRQDDGKLIVINELPLEDYLKGLGEVSGTEPYEKVKAILIAARSYAYYYVTSDEKFPGKPYNLDDDPDVSQKYIGYGFEQRAPTIKKAVEETKGEVVTLNGVVVKTPYFSQSDGTKTKSAKEVWNWNASYLVSVDDSACDGTYWAGHGVGMSGCGARGMANSGSDYIEILEHYYTGTFVSDLY